MGDVNSKLKSQFDLGQAKLRSKSWVKRISDYLKAISCLLSHKMCCLVCLLLHQESRPWTIRQSQTEHYQVLHMMQLSLCKINYVYVS